MSRSFLFLLFTLSALASTPLPAVAKSPDSHNACYRGTIGQRGPLYIRFSTLDFKDSWRHHANADEVLIDGRFAGQPLELYGKYNSTRHVLTLDHYEIGNIDTDNPNGLLTGTFDPDRGDYHGKWTRCGTKHKKQADFHFTRIARIGEFTSSCDGRYDVKVEFPVLEGSSPFYTALNARLRADAETTFSRIEKQEREESGNPNLPKETNPYCEDTITASITYADESVVCIVYTEIGFHHCLHSALSDTYRTFVWENGQLKSLEPTAIIPPESWGKMQSDSRLPSAWRSWAPRCSGKGKTEQEPYPTLCVTPTGLSFGEPKTEASFPLLKDYLNPNTPLAQLAQTATAKTQKR